MDTLNDGDLVLCIRDFRVDNYQRNKPIKGSTYTVRDISDECGCGQRLLLYGVGSSLQLGREWACFCKLENVYTSEAGWSHHFFVKLNDSKYTPTKEELAEMLVDQFMEAGKMKPETCKLFEATPK